MKIYFKEFYFPEDIQESIRYGNFSYDFRPHYHNFLKNNYDFIHSKVKCQNKSTLTNLSTNFADLILPSENFSSLLLHLICISINKTRKVCYLHLNATSAKEQ